MKPIPGSEDLKRRLLVDMLRSKANACALVPERGVLPRLADAAGDARRLVFLSGPGEFVDILVVDVSDAFFAQGVEQGEQRWQAVLGPDNKVYVFCVLCMGGGAAPLIWGRTSAWLSRHTTAMEQEDTFRMQVFVDDPFMAARGTYQKRRRVLATAVLFWLAMGLLLSWRKKQIGPRSTGSGRP